MTDFARTLLGGLLPALALAPFLCAQAPGTRPSPGGIRPPRGAAAYALPDGTYEKAVAYSRARYRLHFASAAWQVLLLAALIALRVAPKLRDLAERVSGKRFVQALVFVPLFLTVVRLLQVFLDVWRHSLALVYDQSVQRWGSWLWDQAKEHLISLVLSTLLIWLLYGVIRRSPRRWWLTFWVASLPILVFVVFLWPVVIDPLFYEFKPLADEAPQLVTEIEKVTARAGLEIPRDRMYLMEASEKRKSVNAYVTGLGASKRVVVWDTTLAKMTTPRTLFVFGHEMGHYILGHVPKTILFVAGLLLVLLFLAHAGARRVLREGERPFGIRGLSDWASLPLLLLFLSISSEVSLPAVNGYSRTNEHDADVYGLEVIHGVVPDPSRAAAEAFQILGEINLSDPSPGPFIRFWLYSHPPLAERIAFARSYDPWSRGEPTRFVPAAAAGAP